ncbi:hypothetical protein SAMN05446037_100511 [Anaerovirgula multivorans]|uniref:Iron-dependent peroxidase n=1 Tax=Anaerovirgula multivorans TaxID=312168 RepID=A0A239C5S1_9FIRM|nr:hypothetical protein [Anaerovirgula multivorans]SNS15242.1 hypothetical protein SAMN05446037_100511 [Anaerovirgula multivorans]
MNYIWDILLRADKQNIDRESIRFKCAKSYSPYMEVSFEDINAAEIDETLIVEINPYYRFFSIFKNIFDINLKENLQFREVLFDIILHHLGELDLKQGLTRKEYYKKFILRDILDNIFAEKIKNNILIFNKDELDIVLNSLISLYETGTSIELFKSVVKKIFPKSVVYSNQDDKKEILIYIDQPESPQLNCKIDALVELFLHIEYEVNIYWQYHFGILDIDETMKIEKMVLY